MEKLEIWFTHTSCGHAIGVTAEGLQWSLENATLAAGAPGASLPVLQKRCATLWVRQGALLAVQPGAVLTVDPLI